MQHDYDDFDDPYDDIDDEVDIAYGPGTTAIADGPGSIAIAARNVNITWTR